jgi:V/A-type H+-transporting ATPase subunit C
METGSLMSDDTRYAYAVARIRGMETGFLSRQQVERFLGEPADGVLRALGETVYHEVFSEVAGPADVETGLARATAETLATVSSISPEPLLMDLFRMRWDFRNLKSLVKASLLKLEDVDAGLVDGIGTIPLPTLEKAVRERDLTPLPDYMADAVRRAENDYRDRSELVAVDRIMDAAMWRRSLEIARSLDNDFIVRYLKTEIDLENIKLFTRIKDAGRDGAELAGAFAEGGTLDLSFFADLLGEPMDAFARALEYGRYGRLAPVLHDWSRERAFALELAADDLLLATTEVASTTAYGIEPLVRYVLTRGLETKLIRAIVAAKLDGVERPEIEARLRSLYA